MIRHATIYNRACKCRCDSSIFIFKYITSKFGFIFLSLQKVEEWRIVFWVTFVIYVVGLLLFCFLMSADLQPWATGNGSLRHGGREEIDMGEQS